jgi:hypothetical protein
LFQKRLTLTPTEENFAIWRERGEKIVSDNSKCIRISVGGLISNFLHGGGITGMDVFWNNTIPHPRAQFPSQNTCGKGRTRSC